MFQALRVRDFRLLWGGGLVSSLGSWLLVLAVPAHVLAVTGSLRDTGLTLAAQYLPQLALGPVAGAVADTWDRRRLMIWANVGCAGAVAVMLLGTAPGRYWVLYAALAAENTAAVFYAPALQARVPAVVGTGPLLASANSLTTASAGVVRLIGGPLGGFLLEACGIRWLICADAVSYLLAAAAMAATLQVRRPRARAGPPRPAAWPATLPRGCGCCAAQPAARALLPVMVVFLTANAALSAVLIPFGIRRLGGSEHTGLLLSCLGAGFLLGAPVIRGLLDRAETRTLLAGSLTATAGGYVLLFTASSRGQRAARGGCRRHVRLHGAGDRADRAAAGDSRRGTRPGQRGVPHRGGGGHPGRLRRRAVPRPGGGPDGGGRRGQPRHPRRGGAGTAHHPAEYA